jgi:hypothetical protein
MSDQLFRRCFAQSRQTEQTNVVTGFARERGFGNCLFGRSANASDFDNSLAAGLLPFARGFHRQLQHWPEQTDFTNGELSRVNSDGNAARSGVAVVSSQRALAVFVQLARFGQSQRMRRNHRAVAQPFAYFCVNLRKSHMKKKKLTQRREATKQSQEDKT